MLVAAGLLAYVLAKGKINFSQVGNYLTSLYLPLGILLMTGQILIGAQRLRMLLAPQGVIRGYLDMVRLTYLGAFFDVFMVTAVGGDAVKAVYLARGIPSGRRTEAVSTLLLDRLMGLLGLLSLTLLIALWKLDLLWADPKIRPYFLVLIGVVLCMLLGIAMLFSRGVHQWRPMQAFLHALPLGALLDRAYAALHQYTGRPRLLFVAWLMSLVVHILGVLGGYVMLCGLGGDRPLLGQFFVAWLISNFICSFAPLGAIGFGQVSYGPIFQQLARVSVGADLATAVQVTYLAAKAPGFFAWLVSREDRKIADC